MSKVFVLDTQKRPLNPVHPGRARLLLTQRRAAIIRHYPFTIIMREEVHDAQIEPFAHQLSRFQIAFELEVRTAGNSCGDIHVLCFRDLCLELFHSGLESGRLDFEALENAVKAVVDLQRHLLDQSLGTFDFGVLQPQCFKVRR